MASLIDILNADTSYTGGSIGDPTIRRDKTLADSYHNAVDTYKALVHQDNEALQRLQARNLETFGAYGATDLAVDFGSFVTGAGIGRAGLALTELAAKKAQAKIAEKLLSSSVSKYAAETVVGTAAQMIPSGQLPVQNDNGTIGVNTDALILESAINAPIDVGVHFAAKGLSAPRESTQSITQFNRDEIALIPQEVQKRNFISPEGDFSVVPLKKAMLDPELAADAISKEYGVKVDRVSIVPDVDIASFNNANKEIKINENLYRKAQEGDESALSELLTAINHEAGHASSFESGNIQRLAKDEGAKQAVNDEEALRHLDSMLIAIKTGDTELANDMYGSYIKYGGDPSVVERIVDEAGVVDKDGYISGINDAEASRIIKESFPYFSGSDKRNFIYRGDENIASATKTNEGNQFIFPDGADLRRLVKASDDPDYLRGAMQAIYKIDVPEIVYHNGANKFENGKLYINAKQSPKEKVVSAVHELIHKKDIESGSFPITTPKAAGDTNELFTYASDLVLSHKLRDKKLYEHSKKMLLDQFEKLDSTGDVYNGTRYALRNKAKAQEVKPKKYNEEFLVDFINNPTEENLAKFVDEIARLRENKLATEKQNFGLGSNVNDVVTQTLINRGMPKEKATKVASNLMRQYDQDKAVLYAKHIDVDRTVTSEKPRKMTRQQSFKQRVYDGLMKYDGARSSFEKEAIGDFKKSEIPYSDFRVERGLISKAISDLKKLTDDIIVDLIEKNSGKLSEKAKQKAINEFRARLNKSAIADALEREPNRYMNINLHGKTAKYESLKLDNIYNDFIRRKQKEETLKAKTEKLNDALEDAESRASSEHYEKNEKLKQERITKEWAKQQRRKTEKAKASAKKRKAKTNERIELRYARYIPSAYHKFKPKNITKNDIKITEFLPADDFKDHKLGTIHMTAKKAYAAGGNEYMQAVTALHEFLHGIYPNKTEKEITDLAFDIINYMAKNDKSFKDRLKLNKVPTTGSGKEFDKNVFSYIYGNKDLVDILFGKSENVKTALDDLESWFANSISSAIKGTKAYAGISSRIKKIYSAVPQMLKDIVYETFDETKIQRQLTSIKREADILLNEGINIVGKEIKSFVDKYNDDTLKKLVKSGLFRQVEPNEKILFDSKYRSSRYKALKKKYKNLDRYIKDSDDPFSTKKYTLTTVGDFRKKFGNDANDVMNLVAMYRIGPKEISKLKFAIEDFKDVARMVDELNSIPFENQIVGYHPHIYDSAIDIEIAYTKADEKRLLSDGFRDQGNHIFTRINPDKRVSSSLFYYHNDERRAGFSKILTAKQVKEAIDRFGREKLKIKKLKKGFEVRYQPDESILRDIIFLNTDSTSMLTNLYKKNFEGIFNERIFAQSFRKQLESLGTSESDILRFIDEKESPPSGFVPLTKHESEFIAKILGSEHDGKIAYVHKDLKDYFFNHEILPDSKELAVAFKVWKSVVSKMKWHLTGTSVSAFANATIGGTLNLLYLGVNPKRISRLAVETFQELKEFKKIQSEYAKIYKQKGFNEAKAYLAKQKKNNTFVELMLEGSVGFMMDNPDLLLGSSTGYSSTAIRTMLKKLDRKFGTSVGEIIFQLMQTLSIDRTTAIGKYLGDKFSQIDMIQRAMAYKYMKTRYGKDEAVSKINDMFVNFSKPEKPISTAIDLSVAPFFTWIMRMQGGLFRVAKDKPLSFGAMIGLYYTLQEITDSEISGDYIGPIRAESWFIHNVFADTMIFHTNLATQMFTGEIDKALSYSLIPKTYEEAYAVVSGKREPLELVGLNFRYY